MSIALNSDLFPEDSNVQQVYHEDEILMLIFYC